MARKARSLRMIPANPRREVKRHRAPAAVDTAQSGVSGEEKRRRVCERTDQFGAIPNADDVGSVEYVKPNEEGGDEDPYSVHEQLCGYAEVSILRTGHRDWTYDDICEKDAPFEAIPYEPRGRFFPIRPSLGERCIVKSYFLSGHRRTTLTKTVRTCSSASEQDIVPFLLLPSHPSRIRRKHVPSSATRDRLVRELKRGREETR